MPKSEWEVAAAAVKENAAALRAMTSHTQVYEWVKAHNLNTRTQFPKFKAQLRKQLGIDYDRLRSATLAQQAQELAVAAAGAPRIVLWAAGDDEAGAFGVCDEEGDALWYGTFHPDDFHHYLPGDQASASTSAALKAVFVAAQTRREADLPVLALTVQVSDHRVDADILLHAGASDQVAVTLEVTQEQNPALEWCRLPGFKGWRESDLSKLLAGAETN
ncbi:hypothetical protein ABH933_001283 [Nocardia sp. GP40]|uniref:hypothetical protein n=1 Tax=Nocardia sp. GP40 TaxID=3156268 RepID=UPI003D20FC06